MKKHVDIIGLLVVSLLFGVSFSFQAIGAEHLEPFSFVLIKHIVAIVAIFPFCLIKHQVSPVSEIKYGLIMAVLQFSFSYLSQVVATEASPGKIGFITSMYIVEVPIIKFLFYKQRINLKTGFSIILSVVGLLFLFDLSNFTFRLSDLLIVICSLILAIQIIFIEKYGSNCNPFKLNFYSFIFVVVFSFIGMLLNKETPSFTSIQLAIIPILYVAIGCSTLANSLQIHCQKKVDATTCSLILSLEAVFSAIAGYVLLGVSLTTIELMGCSLVLVGVILCITAQGKQKEVSLKTCTDSNLE